MRPNKLRETMLNVAKMARAGMDDAQIEIYVDTIITNDKEVQVKLHDCSKCPDLVRTRSRHVPGEGNLKARIMFVGQAPGEIENDTGKPFVGPAGQLLDKILEAAGWKRDDVYITNVVHCYPENDRQPNITEIANCRGYLNQEIGLVNPEVIICLGSIAANTLIHPDFKITKEHGKWFQDKDGRKMMAVFHPAFILRKQGEEQLAAKKMVWKAIKDVKQFVEVPVNGG